MLPYLLIGVTIKIFCTVGDFPAAVRLFRDDDERHIHSMIGESRSAIHVGRRATVSHLDVTYVIQECAAVFKMILLRDILEGGEGVKTTERTRVQIVTYLNTHSIRPLQSAMHFVSSNKGRSQGNKQKWQLSLCDVGMHLFITS